MEAMISHLASVDGTESAASKAYCRYLPVRIGSQTCAALVDSGNLWRNVISLPFLHQLGLTLNDLRPLAIQKVATAKAGAALRVLGELKKAIHLNLGGLDTRLKTRPVVVEGLAMPFNLSGPFLKLHNIDQLHSRNAVRYQGREIPLCTQQDELVIGTAGESPRHSSAVYTMDDVDVPGNSQLVVALRASEVERRALPSGDGLLHGAATFEAATDLHTWNGAMVTCAASGQLQGGLMNTLAETIHVPAGQRYGTFTRVNTGAEAVPLVGALQVAAATKTGTAANGTKPKQWTREQKKDWLRQEFKLDDSPCLRTTTEKADALALLLEFWDVFSHNGEFGKTTLLKHDIFTEEVPPIRTKNRPINPALEPSLRKQLDVWLEQDVIEPSSSPWSFALVAVPKKSGTVRWCVDYRRLNDITKKDAFPLPNIEDNLARLARSKVFSGLDGCGAFHVVEITDRDKAKTAFGTPWGSYHFRRMPFGLTNAPATYSRLVQRTLEGIPYEMALPYLDDTCIHSKDVPSHLHAMRRVLQAYRKAGLRLQPSKCQLFKDDIEYLGHRITAAGVRPMPQYTEVVRDWPLPKTRSEARTFLGKVGYYRRFIQHYSHIAAPWMSVTGKGTPEEERTPLVVTTEMKQTFKELKGRLLRAPILAYPQFDSAEPFILDTDWSHDAQCIGAVLSQRQDGLERAICYGAKKMSQSQANYPPNKGELFAVIFFMRQWRYYLQHRQFILRTDHQSLKWIRTMEHPCGLIERWLDTLANFDFTVQHRAGVKHGNADALSRTAHGAPSVDATGPEADRELHALRPDHTWTKADIRQSQVDDIELRQLRRWVRRRQEPPELEVRTLSATGQAFARQYDSLSLDQHDLLVRNDRSGPLPDERPQVCLPKALWDDAICKVHEVGGHQAVEATVSRLLRHLYFPAMRREVTEYIAACRECQMKNRKSRDQQHTLVSVQDGYPFRRVAIDFVGPLTRSRQGNCYLLTAKCTFTRWVEAYPLQHATAAAAISTLEKEYFSRYGIPEQLHSDQGAQFKSGLFTAVARELGIQLTTTPAYNPKSNPVERSHRDLGAALRALVKQNAGSWEDVLPQALFAMRTAVCRSTGLAPYQLLFGRDASQPLDLIFGKPATIAKGPSSAHEYVRQLRQRIDAAQAYAREHVGAAVRRQRRAYHTERKSFAIGTMVWLYTPKTPTGASRKLTCYWTGPWTVTKIINRVMVQLIPDPLWTTRQDPCTVSIDRIKLYQPPTTGPGRDTSRQPEEDDDVDQETDEFMEAIPDPADDDPEDVAAGPLPRPPAAAPGPPRNDDDDDAHDDDDDDFGGGGFQPEGILEEPPPRAPPMDDEEGEEEEAAVAAAPPVPAARRLTQEQRLARVQLPWEIAARLPDDDPYEPEADRALRHADNLLLDNTPAQRWHHKPVPGAPRQQDRFYRRRDDESPPWRDDDSPFQPQPQPQPLPRQSLRDRHQRLRYGLDDSQQAQNITRRPPTRGRKRDGDHPLKTGGAANGRLATDYFRPVTARGRAKRSKSQADVRPREASVSSSVWNRVARARSEEAARQREEQQGRQEAARQRGQRQERRARRDPRAARAAAEEPPHPPANSPEPSPEPSPKQKRKKR